MGDRRIQACLNGARARGFHPLLPVTPSELAAEAAACAAAGAVAVHVHPRNARGEETLDPAAIGAAVAAIRRAAPGLPVSVSTGDWIEPDDRCRLEALRAWSRLPPEARPDEASVNLSEPTAPLAMQALLSGGIGVEAGLASVADADRLLALGLLPRCRRILVEMDDVEAAAAEAVSAAILLLLGTGAPERQLHGSGRSAWPMARRAVALGLMLRLGLEDVAELPDGSVARDNAALVAAGLAL
ncbi:3-keto-5-aminohexanoate cleavage protein [Falsiroseomonas sp. HW251]|uniref:3-keto-5-aminohexanoate cleavage protein n=1 Tax=Falsiroseomonas sp. HW251 TaxID=3390998 RepID=UPI003D312447